MGRISAIVPKTAFGAVRLSCAAIHVECLDDWRTAAPGEERMKTIADIGAAVIGTGFIGTVHVEALRRIGVQVRGVLGSTPGARRGAGRGARRPARLRVARGPAATTRRSTSSTSPRPTTSISPQATAILAAGRHVVCEKPLAMTADESAELVAAGRGDRPRQRGQLQHPLLPAQPARPRRRRRRRARRRPARHRPLLPGLAAARDRLELAARSRTAAARCGRSATSARTGST